MFFFRAELQGCVLKKNSNSQASSLLAWKFIIEYSRSFLGKHNNNFLGTMSLQVHCQLIIEGGEARDEVKGHWGDEEEERERDRSYYGAWQARRRAPLSSLLMVSECSPACRVCVLKTQSLTLRSWRINKFLRCFWKTRRKTMEGGVGVFSPSRREEGSRKPQTKCCPRPTWLILVILVHVYDSSLKLWIVEEEGGKKMT